MRLTVTPSGQAGPLISVAPEISQRVRPGGLLLLSGFRRDSLATVSAAFAPYFETCAADDGEAEDDSAPRLLRVALEREGWLAVEARRNDAPVSSAALSESAVM